MTTDKMGRTRAPTNDSRYTHVFNAMIARDVHALLLEHCLERHLTQAHVLRQALDAYLNHEIHGNPTCANNTRCLCPAMWSRIGPRQPEDNTP
jgi:hypothetical protein